MHCFLKSQSSVLPLSNTFEVCSTFNLIYLNVCYIPKCLSLSSISQIYLILQLNLLFMFVCIFSFIGHTLTTGASSFSCYNLIASKSNTFYLNKLDHSNN